MSTNSISKMPAKSLSNLLIGLIDYAGLFPPAGVSMEKAVANYAKYHREQGWSFLGSFIVPASRLKEFEKSFGESGEQCWYLSVVCGSDVEKDIRETVDFVARNFETDRVRVGAVELKADSSKQIREYSKFIDESFGEREVGTYFEISPDVDTTSLLRAIRDCRTRAKIRTGGLVESAFPKADKIAQFISLCAQEGVAFKATAGLHHPLRCVKPLTYEGNAPTGTMHGFLNVFVAAVAAYTSPHLNISQAKGMEILRAILLNDDPAMFRFEDSFLTVTGFTDSQDEFALRIPPKRIEEAREHFCISFGSCSFEEPIEDLRCLNLL